MAYISANSSLALQDLQNQTETTPVLLFYESTALELDLWASMVKKKLNIILTVILLTLDLVQLAADLILTLRQFGSNLMSSTRFPPITLRGLKVSNSRNPNPPAIPAYLMSTSL